MNLTALVTKFHLAMEGSRGKNTTNQLYSLAIETAFIILASSAGLTTSRAAALSAAARASASLCGLWLIQIRFDFDVLLNVK